MTEDEKAIAEAERAGFDLSLVESNLELTPTERVLRHDGALETVLMFRAAGAAWYEQAASTSLEDLIAAKEAVGREKDLLAVKELRAIGAIRKRK